MYGELCREQRPLRRLRRVRIEKLLWWAFLLVVLANFQIVMVSL